MTKEKITITVDKEILKLWKRYCDDYDINKSKRIERYLKEDLKKKK
jgi:hypothetical protein